MKYEFFKNVTSKEELYSQYKKLAMEHHPDHGGRVEDMQKINAEYNDLKARVWNTHKSATGETYTSETATADAPDRFREIINRFLHILVCVILEKEAFPMAKPEDTQTPAPQPPEPPPRSPLVFPAGDLDAMIFHDEYVVEQSQR